MLFMRSVSFVFRGPVRTRASTDAEKQNVTARASSRYILPRNSLRGTSRGGGRRRFVIDFAWSTSLRADLGLIANVVGPVREKRFLQRVET